MALHHINRIDRKNLENLYALAILVFLVILSLKSKEATSSFGLLDVPVQVSATSSYVFSFEPNQTNDFIQARNYVVYDVIDKKVLLSKSENEVVPLASITKLMTAITAKELDKGTDSIIKVIPSAIDGTYDIGLKDGQLWSLDEIIKYMLVFSSNDAANIISMSITDKIAFIETMNKIGEREGMSSLRFTNPNGLDNGLVLGGSGSALDVARLMSYAYKKIPDLIDATTKSRVTVVSSSGALSGIPNTNQMVDRFIGLEGSKTGFTEEAGGNLVMIFDVFIGHPIVIVVLGSTRNERFDDVEKLYESTKKALK